MADFQRYFRNWSTLSPVYSGKAFGGNWIKPNIEGVDYPTIIGYLYYLDYDTQKLVETTTTAGTQNIVDTHQLVFNCTTPLTANDVEAVESDPNIMMRVWFDGETLPSGWGRHS